MELLYARDTLSMAGDISSAVPPSVLWAQRTDKVYITIDIEDCKSPTIKIEENSLYFHGKSGDDKDHAITIEFYKEIVPQDCKYVVLGRHIPFVLQKKEAGPYWPRLLKSTTKAHWLKTDFNKWKDEDDSDVEMDKDDFKYDDEDMDGNFGGNPPDKDSSSDSDDESPREKTDAVAEAHGENNLEAAEKIDELATDEKLATDEAQKSEEAKAEDSKVEKNIDEKGDLHCDVLP